MKCVLFCTIKKFDVCGLLSVYLSNNKIIIYSSCNTVFQCHQLRICIYTKCIDCWRSKKSTHQKDKTSSILLSTENFGLHCSEWHPRTKDFFTFRFIFILMCININFKFCSICFLSSYLISHNTYMPVVTEKR